jgi:uncharacterized membrane protein YfcA
MTSVGSGALIGLALIMLYKLRPRRVVGTDVFHAAIVMWTAGIAHMFSGNVDFALMGTILIGSLPGVWLGTWLVPHVPVAALRHLIGVVLAGAALGVLTKAGADIPAAAIVLVPILLFVGVQVVVRAQARQAHMRPRVPEGGQAAAADG